MARWHNTFIVSKRDALMANGQNFNWVPVVTHHRNFDIVRLHFLAFDVRFQRDALAFSSVRHAVEVVHEPLGHAGLASGRASTQS